MCTAINFKGYDGYYFGRNLDLDRDYGERVITTPKDFTLKMRKTHDIKTKYSIIGMAVVKDSFPLYFDGTNEKGVSMAGLSFPDNAHYSAYQNGKTNVTPFELIPYILGTCANMTEVKGLLDNISIVNVCFSEELPLSPLHWMISYEGESIVLECLKDGMKVYNNSFGVLTNNPTFDYHIMNMNNYMGLYEGAQENRLSKELKLNNYSLGMGAMGLPGDYSSVSRFVRAVYIKEKSPLCRSKRESVNQLFHILSGVAMPKGCVLAKNGEYEYTRYTCCCDGKKGRYYYNTYDEMGVREVSFSL